MAEQKLTERIAELLGSGVDPVKVRELADDMSETWDVGFPSVLNMFFRVADLIPGPGRAASMAKEIARKAASDVMPPDLPDEFSMFVKGELPHDPIGINTPPSQEVFRFVSENVTLFTIEPDGTTKINPKLGLDEVSLRFWQHIAKHGTQVKALAESGHLCEVYGNWWEESGDRFLAHPPIQKRSCRLCGKKQLGHQQPSLKWENVE